VQEPSSHSTSNDVTAKSPSHSMPFAAISKLEVAFAKERRRMKRENRSNSIVVSSYFIEKSFARQEVLCTNLDEVG
jgi:hypothetical protein